MEQFSKAGVTVSLEPDNYVTVDTHPNVSSLSQSMNSMSMKDAETIPSHPKASSAPVKQPLRGLPSLNSAEWETEDLPPPPPQTRTKKRA